MLKQKNLFNKKLDIVYLKNYQGDAKGKTELHDIDALKRATNNNNNDESGKDNNAFMGNVVKIQGKKK